MHISAPVVIDVHDAIFPPPSGQSLLSGRFFYKEIT